METLSTFQALLDARYALNAIRNTAIRHANYRNTYDVAAMLDRVIERLAAEDEKRGAR